MPVQAKGKTRPDFTIAAEPPAPPTPAFGAFAMDDLKTAFQCRYICNEPGQPVRYCGKPSAPRPSGLHSSWCCDHLPIVFNLPLSVGRIPPRKARV